MGISGLEGTPSLPAGLSELSNSALSFLIGSFPVPPFLLPIYQAAGIEYGVPWQVLAAINEIETDFGRDLSRSSAGAEGWMQFMPSTWKQYGVSADGDGPANPDDPVDAIFSAARYLAAAGAGKSLSKAIFAYNHAQWYVNSVELHARLLQIVPSGVVDALTGLMQARFPIAGKLGPDADLTPALTQVDGQPAVTLSGPTGADVIASADGTVVAVGRSAALGSYVTIRDSYGNQFTYAHLTDVQTLIPVVTPKAQSLAATARMVGLPLGAKQRAAPTQAATRAGASTAHSTATSTATHSNAASKSSASNPNSDATSTASDPVKVRLFADPSRPASYSAGGSLQLQSKVISYLAALDGAIGAGTGTDQYTRALALKRGTFTLAPLHPGASVLAGTVLGRVGRGANGSGSIVLQLRPAGSNRAVDPRAIVAGWELLGRLTSGRSVLGGVGPAGAYGTHNTTVGQLLLAPKSSLADDVLTNSRVQIDPCDRSAIAAGHASRQALAVIEYLAYSGLAPDVTGLVCGRAAGASTAIDISGFNGTPVAGHQTAGGIVDVAIRDLLALQGALRPSRIVSLRSYPWQATTLALPDHADEVEIDYGNVGGASTRGLNTAQWGRLIGRLGQISSNG